MSGEPSDSTHFDTFWQELLDDTEATATAYEDEGWDVCTVTPGDVTPLYDTEKPLGLSVLVPNPEFDRVEELVENGTFTNVEVYRNTVGSFVCLLVVERDVTSETAILIPVYYNFVTESAFVEAVGERGELPIHLRALDTDSKITFGHENYSLFMPDRGDENDDT